MSKEEQILKDTISGIIIYNSVGTWKDGDKIMLDEVDLDDTAEDIFKSASEYAKQEAIAFAEWIGRNDYIFYGGENNTWYHSDDRKRKNPLTTEQLYQLFLNQSKQL